MIIVDEIVTFLMDLKLSSGQFGDGLIYKVLMLLFLNIWVLGGTLLSVLLAGFYCAFVGHDSEAFARAGSLWVAFAVCVVFANHHVSMMVDGARDIQKRLGNPNFKQEIEKQYPGLILSEQRVQIIDGARRALELVERELPNYDRISSRIVSVEFICGVVGTLIWGFGNTPFN